MNKKEILEKLKNGEISIEEATRLLEDIDANSESENLEATIKKIVKNKLDDAAAHINSFNKTFTAPGGKFTYTSKGFKDDDDDDDEDLSSWDAIRKLAPFSSSKTIGELVQKELDKGTDVSWDNIVSLAPFMDEEDLAVIAHKALAKEKPNIKLVVRLAPFIDEDDLAEIVRACDDKLSLKLIIKLAPFLDEDVVDELVKKLANQAE